MPPAAAAAAGTPHHKRTHHCVNHFILFLFIFIHIIVINHFIIIAMRFLLTLSLVSAYTPVPNGVLVPLASGWSAVLAVEGTAAFRLSLVNSSLATNVGPNPSSMIAPKQQHAPYTITSSGTVVNLTAPGLGSVSIDAATGAFALADAAGAPLTQSPGPAAARTSWGRRNDTCAQPRSGADAASPRRSKGFPQGLRNATQAACCAACNSDPTCTAWVWADATHPDKSGNNCWPLLSLGGEVPRAGRVLGGAAPPPAGGGAATTLLLTTSPAARFTGSGTDGESANRLNRTNGQALVANMASWTPSFYCTDGWALLAVSPFLSASEGRPSASALYPMRWEAVRGGAGGVEVTVGGGTAAGQPVDFYLYPAPGLRAFVAAQSALEGRAAVPPRYALGFLACRWGWSNQSYIEGVLREFRGLGMPVDAFVRPPALLCSRARPRPRPHPHPLPSFSLTDQRL